MRSLAVWLGCCFACGATPPAATGSESASVSESESASGSAGGPARAARIWPDAGTPDDPIRVADAGMAELGIAECDALISRIMACPGFPPDEKQSLAESHEVLSQQALTASPSERASLAAMCRETARQFEEFLLGMSC